MGIKDQKLSHQILKPKMNQFAFDLNPKINDIKQTIKNKYSYNSSCLLLFQSKIKK